MEFGFTIITCTDNTEVIDRSVSTAFCDLSPEQMLDYMEVETVLYQLDREKLRVKKQTMLRNKIIKNPFYKFAYMCGLI